MWTSQAHLARTLAELMPKIEGLEGHHSGCIEHVQHDHFAEIYMDT
jgi:hypothetical protein